MAGIFQLDDVYWLESFAQHIGTLYHRARQQDILVMCQGYQGLFDRIPETLKEFFLVDEVVVFKTLYHAKPDSVSLERVGAFPRALKPSDGASGLYGFAKKQFGERRIPPLYFSANRAWAYDQPDDSPPKAGQEDWAIAIECRQCPHRQDSAPPPGCQRAEADDAPMPKRGCPDKEDRCASVWIACPRRCQKAIRCSSFPCISPGKAIPNLEVCFIFAAAPGGGNWLMGNGQSARAHAQTLMTWSSSCLPERALPS